MIEDTLKMARSLQRLVLTATLWTLLFSLGLVSLEPRVARLHAIRNLMRADFLGYDNFTQEKLDCYIRNRRAVISRWRYNTFGTENSTTGLDDLLERIVRPIRTSKFQVEGTTLVNLNKAILSQINSTSFIQDLYRNIEVVAVSLPDSQIKLEALLGPYYKKKVPIAFDVHDGDEVHWLSRSLGSMRLFTVSEWPDLRRVHGDGVPLPLTTYVEVESTALPRTALVNWIDSVKGLVASMDGILSEKYGRTVFVGDTYFTLSNSQRDQTLEQLHQTIVSEVQALDPSGNQATFWGVQVPVAAIVVGASLALLILSFALTMHTIHLRRHAKANADDILLFAWLPLTLRSNIAWVLATAVSVLLLPSTSLWILSRRLETFGWIDWPFGSTVILITSLLIATFGFISLYNLDGTRNAVGRCSVRGAIMDDIEPWRHKGS